MKVTGEYRQNYLAEYGYPMPFAVKAVGQTVMLEGEPDIATDGALHSLIEICWCISGCGEIIFFQQPYEMKKNDVFIFMPGETHHYRIKSEEWRWRWLCIDGPLAEAMIFSCKLPRHISCRMDCPEEWYQDIAENISSESPSMIADLSGIAWRIIARIIDGYYPKCKVNVYENCVKYIKQHFADPQLSIDFLADRVGVSRSTLTKLFREKQFRPISSYIRDIRLANACALLSGTDWTVREIAQKCGYANSISFVRAFRKKEQCPPGEFRNRHHAEKSTRPPVKD